MVHVHSLVTLLSLSPIRMRNSWRECQGLTSSGPPRERRSNNTATASSSGRGKKTHTHTPSFLLFPFFPQTLFFHVPSLPLLLSSLISLILSLLSSFIFASPLPSFLLFFPLSLFSSFPLPSFTTGSYYSHSTGFPGSQPVSMDVQNIRLLHEKPYRVSWKADGTR